MEFEGSDVHLSEEAADMERLHYLIEKSRSERTTQQPAFSPLVEKFGISRDIWEGAKTDQFVFKALWKLETEFEPRLNPNH